MDKRRSGGGNDFDMSWFGVFFMLYIFWPVGLWMLVGKIRNSPGPEQNRRKPLSWMSILLIVTGFVVLRGGSGLGISGFGGFAMLGGVAMFAYSRLMKKNERAHLKYANVIGARPVVPIGAIAAAMPVSFEQALKDLQKMIDAGYFGTRAYIDHSTNLFIADSRISQNFINKVLREYGVTPGAVSPRGDVQPPQSAIAPEPVKIDPRSDAEREFQQKLDEIRAVNERIADAEITARIYRIEEIAGGIFDLVKQKPEKRGQIHTFMNYYLPTTLKLLRSYGVLERQNVLGQNIVSSKENIEKMVDQLVFAFERQLDQMFESEARDINTDITVLERMMARDGLSENPYTLPSAATAGGRAVAAQSLPEDGARETSQFPRP